MSKSAPVSIDGTLPDAYVQVLRSGGNIMDLMALVGITNRQTMTQKLVALRKAYKLATGKELAPLARKPRAKMSGDTAAARAAARLAAALNIPTDTQSDSDSDDAGSDGDSSGNE